MPKARQNASDQVMVGFSFAFDWLREWREFSRPIKERIKAKSVQPRFAFDIQVKTALSMTLVIQTLKYIFRTTNFGSLPSDMQKVIHEAQAL